MRPLKNKEVAVLDRNAEFLGVPTATLMENAGRNAAKRALELLRYGDGGAPPVGANGVPGASVDPNGGPGGGRPGWAERRPPRTTPYNESHAQRGYQTCVVMCGPGNNGGDGFVMARYLSRDLNVTVVLVGGAEGIKTRISRDNYGRLPSKVEVIELPSEPSQREWNEVMLRLESADLVVDALLGVGVKGELRSPFNRCVRGINSAQTNSVVVSVDVPSGLGGELAVVPRMTVTFHAVKEGMNEENCGRIVVEDIGIPPKAQSHVGPGSMLYYPKPRRGSHKGQNGRLLIIGGGPFTGAPALSAMSAMRAGVDLVHIAVPGSIHGIVSSMDPNFIVHAVGGEATKKFDGKTGDTLVKLVEQLAPTAVLIGPGIGDSATTQSAVSKLIKAIEVPMVLDADAFAVFEGRFRGTTMAFMPSKKGVVTPHTGEFLTLTGEKVKGLDFTKRMEMAKSWAEVLGWTVILKGSVDVITDGSEVKLCDLGNDGMTVGGTGDVLAGVTAGLLAKGAEPIHAARMAAFLTNHCGDLVFAEKSYGLLPTDIIEAIPGQIKANIQDLV